MKNFKVGWKMGAALVLVAAAATGALAWWATPGAAPCHGAVVQNVRVQALSPTLIRLEERGPRGFEDRETFNVVNRNWQCLPLARQESGDEVHLTGPSWQVVIPSAGSTVKGTRVESLEGKTLFAFTSSLPSTQWLPDPAKMPPAWVMADHPRVVPAPWGAVPPPRFKEELPAAGWDLENRATDIYVFVPGAGGYPQLKQDYLALTGPVPLPPLFTFGYWSSRYHPYSEQTALQEIDTFRTKGFPIDVFVVDTDWRLGASHGYQINTELFSDMGRFIGAAHDRHVRLMFNDHPEPQDGALDKAELQTRWDGLTSLLKLGADVWWYDRNWMTHLAEPVPGLRKEVWGMRVYHDITLKFRPEQRPLIMSNVQGIDNGFRRYAPSPAVHRFPIWWTGDTYADWIFLEKAVANAVDSGVISALPYVHDDCGGFSFRSIPELQARFFEFCVFSPVLRTHSMKRHSRLPWDFDPEAEAIMTGYARLRYRLLPVLYTAARHAHETGTPLLRRLDLYWPEHAESASYRQYLLGDDLLVSPVMTAAVELEPLPPADLTANGKTGVLVELFMGSPSGTPALSQVVPQLQFHGWPVQGGRAVQGGLSARWTTRWHGVPETGEYMFRLDGGGNSRLWINGNLLVDDRSTVNDHLVPLHLNQGQDVDILVEHDPVNMPLHAEVQVAKPSRVRPAASHSVWLPPGEWENAWTGQRQQGPAQVNLEVPLQQLPLFARVGGVVLTLPQMQHTGEAPWSTVVVDAYVPTQDGSQTRELYEDDGISNDYLKGKFRKTAVTLTRTKDRVTLRMDKAQGSHTGMPGKRTWMVRLHLPAGATSKQVLVDGEDCAASKNAACGILAPAPGAVDMVFKGPGSAPGPLAGPVVEVNTGELSVKQTVAVDVTL